MSDDRQIPKEYVDAAVAAKPGDQNPWWCGCTRQEVSACKCLSKEDAAKIGWKQEPAEVARLRPGAS
jgi:hypothetical protein